MIAILATSNVVPCFAADDLSSLSFSLDNLPEWFLIDVEDNLLACYDFEGAKSLVAADLMFNECLLRANAAEAKYMLVSQELTILRQDFWAMSDQLDLSINNFEELNKVYQESETSNAMLRMRPPIPVVVLVVIGVGLAGFGVGAAVGLASE